MKSLDLQPLSQDQTLIDLSHFSAQTAKMSVGLRLKQRTPRRHAPHEKLVGGSRLEFNSVRCRSLKRETLALALVQSVSHTSCGVPIGLHCHFICPQGLHLLCHTAVVRPLPLSDTCLCQLQIQSSDASVICFYWFHALLIFSFVILALHTLEGCVWIRPNSNKKLLTCMFRAAR